MPQKNKTKNSRNIIRADRNSGAEGSTFAMSILIRVIERGNRRIKFKFSFWAFSAPAGRRHGTEWIEKAGYQRASEQILRFIQKPGGLAYFRNLQRQIIKEEDIFEKEAQSLRTQLPSLSDMALANAYSRFANRYAYYYGLGIITFLYETILSDRLMTNLLARSPRAADYLPTLLTNNYTSFMVESERELEKIAATRSSLKRQELMTKYQQDFFYIRSNYWQAPEPEAAFIQNQIKSLKQKSISRSVRPPKDFRLTAEERSIIELLRLSEAIHDQRKQINMIGSYLMFKFLAEAERRRKLSRSLTRRAFWFEYRDLLLRTSRLVPRLQKRSAYSAIYNYGHSFYLNYVAIKERPTESGVDMKINGTPASPGVYRGLVRRVLLKADFKKFRSGEILVSDSTRPEFLPVMKKAGAIVTDEGGLTCHAAVVARELKLPCVVGTKDASRRLHDGDEVEVDAGQGTIKVLKKK